MVSTQPPIDTQRVQAFAGKALGDISGTMVTLLAALGDRLGLFKALAANGPTTSAELAERTGTAERYVREWLGGMVTAGYLEYDAATGRFSLPIEHVPTLAEEGGPFFVGGPYQLLLAEAGQFDRVQEAFRTGSGIPLSAYPPELWLGQERFSAGWVDHLLGQVWIPAIPEIRAKLERGAALADVGCGSGGAVIRLAKEFPSSYFVGYDLHEPVIAHAIEAAQAAGVADRVRFQRLDAANGLPDQYDVVTTFDVVHDVPDPVGLLRSIRQALNPGGIYLCLEMNCSGRLDENVGPIGALFHGISIFYCLSVSLAESGAALGTLGLPETKVRTLSDEAGFGQVDRVPLESPFHALYAIRP